MRHNHSTPPCRLRYICGHAIYQKQAIQKWQALIPLYKSPFTTRTPRNVSLPSGQRQEEASIAQGKQHTRSPKNAFKSLPGNTFIFHQRYKSPLITTQPRDIFLPLGRVAVGLP